MLHIVSWLEVESGREAEFEAMFAARPGLVDDQPGFQGLQLVRKRGSSRYALVTTWTRREDFERYSKTEAFKQVKRPLPPWAKADGLDMYDVVSATEEVPGLAA